MTETGAVTAERMRDKCVRKSILYGNTAKLLSEKLENGHTHEWNLYVRPYNDEDLSKYIRKVQFKLHDSYPNPLRVIDSPPFELTETGWGEFEVQVKFFFIDVNEKPVTLFYYLHLFQPQVVLSDSSQIVLSEFYDEIIFNEPSELMFAALTADGNGKPVRNRYIDYNQVRRKCKEKVQAANKEILAEIADLRGSLKDALELIQKLQKELDVNGSPNKSSNKLASSATQ